MMAHEFVHQRKSFLHRTPQPKLSVAAMRKLQIARRAFRQLNLVRIDVARQEGAPDIYAEPKNCQELRVTADQSARS
jgi:hypothetical protein